MGRCFSPRGCEEISGCRSKSGHDTWLFPAGDRAPGSLQGTRRPARQDDDLQHLGGIILVLRCNFLLGGRVPCSMNRILCLYIDESFQLPNGHGLWLMATSTISV